MPTIEGDMIEITGSMPRHEIVRKVINTFIDREYEEKGEGVEFRYPVENLPDGKLFISRPHIRPKARMKVNFDFKIEITAELGLEKGKHKEIGLDLQNKKQENPQRFQELCQAITEIYECSENDVDRILSDYPDLQASFQTGAKVEVLLKVLKWMVINEDIVYWNGEGRAMLYNGLKSGVLSEQ